MRIIISASSDLAIKKLKNYRVLIENEMPAYYFSVPTRLSREELRTFNAGKAYRALLAKHDRIDKEACDALKAIGFEVKITSYNIFAKKDSEIYKVWPLSTGRVKLTASTLRAWKSNGRFN